jgi:hypothetical protein
MSSRAYDQVDAQYKSELKDLADQYYGRFRAEFRAELAGLRADLVKWMFVFWTGSVLATGGLLLGLLRSLKP